MVRDPSLVPLSRQHQHALALCVRLDRALKAGNADLEAWQAEIQQQFDLEITVHFAAEEQELFPTAAAFPELRPLVEELRDEHVLLRDLFSKAGTRSLDADGLRQFADAMPAHIRKEERQLFEGMQQLFSAGDLAKLGEALDRSLADASSACALPSDATRIRPKA